MKSVVQGETIDFQVIFYDKEPALGGVPTDPDGAVHTWEIQNESHSHVSAVNLLESGVWPTQTKFYFAISDDPIAQKFEVKAYLSDAERTAAVPGTEIVSTGVLNYGVYVLQALNPVGASVYSGTISITMPDNHNHSWVIQNDTGGFITSINLLENGSWPTQPQFWFDLSDTGTGYIISGYDDAARTNKIVDTAEIPYGVGVAIPFVGLQTLGYSGDVTANFPGGAVELFDIIDGGGVEPFEIEDIGATEPTYQIWNESNEMVVSDTLFPTHVAVGTFDASYDVPIDAVPGENWRLEGRGKINGVDTFVRVDFRVVDANVATDEAARLVSLSAVKIFLEIGYDRDDLFLLQLIDSASETVETYTGQQFHREEKISVFNGEGRDSLHITPGPMHSLTKVEKREATIWNEVSTTSFDFSEWFLYRIDGNIFDSGRKNWRIFYESGMDRAPRQIRQAIMFLIRYWYTTKDRTGVLSDVVGGGLRVNYQEVIDDLPPDVISVLKLFRRLV